MPDVFQVLQQDHDEVRAMLAQLEVGPNAVQGASSERLAFRKSLVEQLIIEESKHEAAEQQYFWPAIRQLATIGERIADEAIDQESAGEQILALLDKTSPADPLFEDLLMRFTDDARAHITFEESQAWPLLRASITADEAEALGTEIIEAKRLAPTRPHPHTPPTEAMAKTAGPVAGVADRLRHVMTGHGRHAS
jgi:hemerythrin-like domain-containing protein